MLDNKRQCRRTQSLELDVLEDRLAEEVESVDGLLCRTAGCSGTKGCCFCSEAGQPWGCCLGSKAGLPWQAAGA